MPTLNVHVDLQHMSDRNIEDLDDAIAALKTVPGIEVEGWGDDEDDEPDTENHPAGQPQAIGEASR